MLEGKKNGVSVPEQTLSTHAVGDFVGSIKEELAKVTWTSREEMQLYIKVVVSSTLIFGIGIYAVDLVIQGVLLGLGTIVRWIGA